MNKWIKIKERLPEIDNTVHPPIIGNQPYYESDKVLVWVEKSEQIEFAKFIYDHNKELLYINIIGYTGDWEVTHWTPLIDAPNLNI